MVRTVFCFQDGTLNTALSREEHWVITWYNGQIEKGVKQFIPSTSLIKESNLIHDGRSLID
jgi:hypothetical protein